MDWTKLGYVQCPGCGKYVIPQRYWHEDGGCGIVNRVKSRIPHWHLYCPRSTLCLYDWIEEPKNNVDINIRKTAIHK